MPDPFVSVIIPVGPYEKQIPQVLLQDLNALSADTEVIFVGCNSDAQAELFESLPSTYQHMYASAGRAQQMNKGADAATGQFLWFLHLDSQFKPELIQQLFENLHLYPDALHYNLLAFSELSDAPMGINAVGANLRSKVLGVPFGDQGFAMAKDLFFQVGCYPENVAYGEDHLFVWHARQFGLRLIVNPHYLLSSPRKYQQQGWFKLTFKYQYLWLRQALPEALKLIKQRYFSPRSQR